MLSMCGMENTYVKVGFYFSRNSRTNKRMLTSVCANGFCCIFTDDSACSSGSSENESDSANYQSNIVES